MARYVLIPVLVIAFSGCTFAERHGRLTYGNFEFSQGRYERARDLYEGVPVGETSDAENIEGLRDYNIGTVDYAVGDIDGALDHWNRAEERASDDEILFRTHFNTGVLHFEQGRYERAYTSFRAALLVHPERETAKRNLELAFDRWQRAGSAEGASSVDESRPRELDASSEDVFEQLRSRERERHELQDEYQAPEDVDDW